VGRRTRVAIARLPRSGDCLDDLRVDVRLFLQRPGTGHNHLLSHTFTPPTCSRHHTRCPVDSRNRPVKHAQ
jgi:hypothetical protein